VNPVTTLVRWDPFRELDLVDRMRGLGWPLVKMSGLPATDVYETDEEYVVELEVPGYEEKELTIEILDHMLTVRGEHETTTETTEKTYRLQERVTQEFERSFELPPTVDADTVKATFRSGILALHARKAGAATPKTIHVET
jgi:HSP20 family protein